jgi:hypothetical protein
MTCMPISVRQPLVSFDGVSEMRRRPVLKRSSLASVSGSATSRRQIDRAEP